MEIEVKFFANFRELTDESEIVFEIKEGSNINDLLIEIIEEWPILSDEFFDGDKLKDYVNVFLNHRNIKDDEGLEAELSEGDTVAIFPPVSGG